MFSRALRIESCADPGFFLVGGGGGGGGVRPDGQKTVWTFVFFKSSTYFTEGVQWFYRENYTFPRIQRGSNIFQGGPTFFFRGGGGGGSNANFHRNPSRRVRTPYPPSGSAHENLHDVIMAQ